MEVCRRNDKGSGIVSMVKRLKPATTTEHGHMILAAKFGLQIGAVGSTTRMVN